MAEVTTQPAAAAFDEFETTDADQAHRWLQTSITAYEPRPYRAEKNFRFRARKTVLGDSMLSRLRFPMGAELIIPPISYVSVVQVFSGWYDVKDGQHDSRAHQSEVILVPNDRDLTVTWDVLDVGLLNLGMTEVRRVAHETTGIDPAQLRFAGGGLPLSHPADLHWRAAVNYVNRAVLPNPDARENPIVRAEATRLLAVALLTTFDNTALHFEPSRVTGSASSRALKRAQNFIDDNCHLLITVSDIAAAAGVSVRSLQQTFVRQLNTTPMHYLRRARLAGAHRDLTEAVPGGTETVASIAAQWGFAHAGRFAVQYREAFGCSPSESLRA